MIEEISKSLSQVNAYPDLMVQLIADLSTYTCLPEDQICITNGSDKAFRLLAEMFIDSNDEMITFSPSYPVIDHAIEMMGGRVVRIPLDHNFTIPSISDIQKKLSNKTKMIYICNPNNPTGNFIATQEEIESILKLGIIVIVDEAYYEFSMQTSQNLLHKYDNLIILRSFSKTFGLAGLRVGYMLGSQNTTTYAKRIEESIEMFNISTPSLAGALYALHNIDEMKKNVHKVNKTKIHIAKKLQELSIDTYSSYTSFLMFNLKKTSVKSEEFRIGMEKEKIILKNVSIYADIGPYEGHIGIPHEKDLPRFITAIESVIN
jgi:histidinol-phosphate aminotransferase